MPERQNRMPQKKSWPGIGHNLPGSVLVRFLKAVNFALLANGLIAPVRTAGNALDGIIGKVPALRAQSLLLSVMSPAVNFSHQTDCQDFLLQIRILKPFLSLFA
jgi:hypothetical protein